MKRHQPTKCTSIPGMDLNTHPRIFTQTLYNLFLENICCKLQKKKKSKTALKKFKRIKFKCVDLRISPVPISIIIAQICNLQCRMLCLIKQVVRLSATCSYLQHLIFFLYLTNSYMKCFLRFLSNTVIKLSIYSYIDNYYVRGPKIVQNQTKIKFREMPLIHFAH